MNLKAILDTYESLRPMMPSHRAGAGVRAARLRDVIGEFDALFLDGYGILNRGDVAIEGARELLEMAESREMPVLVVTNGARNDEATIGGKYAGLDLPITPEQVVSSRSVLTHWLTHQRPQSWRRLGVVDGATADVAVAGLRQIRLDPKLRAPWGECDAIALMGATRWNADWHARLAEVAAEGCPILIANADVAAPQISHFSLEPGHIGWRLLHENQAEIHWFGKPHSAHFELAWARFQARYGHEISDRRRIAMVGDSLHTDILGGAAAGFSTVLVTGEGLFSNGGAEAALDATGLMPDIIVERI